VRSVERAFFPLDEGLEVLDGWSPWVVEQSLWMSQAVCSYREAIEGMERLAGIPVSKSTLHRWVDKYGGKLAEQRQKEGKELWESGLKGEMTEPREPEVEELGIGLDGMMVFVEGEWHEVKVGTTFTFGPSRGGEVQARGISYTAWYGEVEDFRQQMWGHVYHHGLGEGTKAIVMGDAASWIDGFAEVYCPERVRIVDWYHALEKVWAVGREAFGEEAKGWVKGVEKKLWEGEIEEVVSGCEEALEGLEDPPGEVRRVPDYFRTRKEQMDYPSFRAAGYPIGSGVVESGCKGIGWRCKGRGQRWKGKGLRAILALKTAGMGGRREWHYAWDEIANAA
jgi:hypothetical protein